MVFEWVAFGNKVLTYNSRMVYGQIMSLPYEKGLGSFGIIVRIRGNLGWIQSPPSHLGSWDRSSLLIFLPKFSVDRDSNPMRKYLRGNNIFIFSVLLF